MAEVQFMISLTLMTCPTCGIQYAIPEDLRVKRARDHANWYCPNGHRLHYPGESDIEKIQREAREAQAQLNTERHLRLVAEKSKDALAKENKRIKRRIAGGVCVCCNRTFENLQQHMQTKHKDALIGGAPQKQIESTKPN